MATKWWGGIVSQGKFNPGTSVVGLLAVVDYKWPEIPCSSSHPENDSTSPSLKGWGSEVVSQSEIWALSSRGSAASAFALLDVAAKWKAWASLWVDKRLHGKKAWNPRGENLLDQLVGQLPDTWVRHPPQITQFQSSHQQTTEIHWVGPEQKSHPSCPAIPWNHELNNKCLMF